ncbi:cytochrome c [Sulfurimonas sp.]|uniref:c-type cytochrome n=1 Tax=Sulfurimonas sp. TaxID=2022749 RepID=UPI003563781A
MRFVPALFLPLFLFAQSSFITPLEYSSSLYKNPRGIGCFHCHGEKGEGKIVANYTHNKQKKNFGGPAINSLNYDDFKKSLEVSKKGMPRYYLTTDEIKALFFYLQQMKVENEN